MQSPTYQGIGKTTSCSKSILVIFSFRQEVNSYEKSSKRVRILNHFRLLFCISKNLGACAVVHRSRHEQGHGHRTLNHNTHFTAPR